MDKFFKSGGAQSKNKPQPSKDVEMKDETTAKPKFIPWVEK